MSAKKSSPDYQQVLAYVKKPISLEFKAYCKKNELEISEVIEGLLVEFLNKNGISIKP